MRSRTLLLASQVAFSLVLVLAAGLLTTSLRRLEKVDKGFDDQHALLVEIIDPRMVIVGLYGVLSQWSAQRTNEIGIRIALGATPSKVCATIMREGLVLVATGLVVGLPAAAAATQTMESLLFGLDPWIRPP